MRPHRLVALVVCLLSVIGCVTHSVKNQEQFRDMVGSKYVFTEHRVLVKSPSLHSEPVITTQNTVYDGVEVLAKVSPGDFVIIVDVIYEPNMEFGNSWRAYADLHQTGTAPKRYKVWHWDRGTPMPDSIDGAVFIKP